MFQRLGQLVARRPLVVILLWCLVGAGLLAATGGWLDSTASEPESFLPADSEQQRGLALLREAFPQLAARSRTVVVACRPGGLQPPDFAFFSTLTQTIKTDPLGRERGWAVLSPDDPFLRQRFVSTDGEAAMLVISHHSHYVSQAAVTEVDHVERLVRANVPPGLQLELTGTAPAGRDYGTATGHALLRTKWVTVGCVLVILLLVYRSPVAALIPIVGIGVCTLLALRTLDALGAIGWPCSNLERMFTIVLIYGAGTDFAMFWLARYREQRSEHPDGNGRTAAAEATACVGPAIVASSATTILGLLSLLATDMIPTRNAGRILGVVLCWAPLAGLTLVPAMVCLAGRLVFWPSGRRPHVPLGQRWIWPKLAKAVARRPLVVLLAGLLLLAPAAVRAGFIRFRYDTLSELPPGSSSLRGLTIADAHFPSGALYAVTLLVQPERKATDAATMREASAKIAAKVGEIDGIEDVYDLTHPLGRQAKDPGAIGGALLGKLAEPFYYAAATQTLRIEVAIGHPPFSTEAMRTMEQVRATAAGIVHSADAGLGPEANVIALGATPYILEVRDYMARDQWRVWIGATVVIWLVVALLVRRIGLALFMVGATLLTYATTLGLAHEFFTHVLDAGGLDYKVKLFLFVIIVAVGQDYNIFLVTRLRQETERFGDTEGVQRAIIRTGSVISNCGLIMAATLGSLWAGGLELLRQLGFALALGMLLDTFIVRPLLMPSFWLCTRKRREARRQNGG